MSSKERYENEVQKLISFLLHFPFLLYFSITWKLGHVGMDEIITL